MARIRTLKPTIWTDQRFVQLSPMARLLVIGMISHADDSGRLFASVTRLAGDVFPGDDFSTKQVRGWRQEVIESGLAHLYAVRGVEYAWFPKWKKHQRISKPQVSVLPQPPSDSATRCGTVPHPDEESPANDSASVPQEGVSLAGGDAGVTEVEVEGNEVPPLSPPRGAKRPRRQMTPPPDKFDLTDEMQKWAVEHAPDVRLVVESARLVDWARGKGERKADWIAAWRNWMSRAQENITQQRQRDASRFGELAVGDEEWMR